MKHGQTVMSCRSLCNRNAKLDAEICYTEICHSGLALFCLEMAYEHSATRTRFSAISPKFQLEDNNMNMAILWEGKPIRNMCLLIQHSSFLS